MLSLIPFSSTTFPQLFFPLLCLGPIIFRQSAFFFFSYLLLHPDNSRKLTHMLPLFSSHFYYVLPPKAITEAITLCFQTSKYSKNKLKFFDVSQRCVFVALMLMWGVGQNLMLVINLQNYLLPLAAKPLGCNFTKKKCIRGSRKNTKMPNSLRCT